MSGPADQSVRKCHERRKESLKGMRQPWEGQWQELAQHLAPKRMRTSLNVGEGQKLRSKIIDSSGSFALRTLASGMHSGITSPARPWFRLTTFDPQLRDFAPVKRYLADVEGIMRDVFQGSNIYNCFHQGYGDLGLFGQSVGILVEDKDKIVRMIQLLHGSFWIARDHRGIATTLYREFSWSVERIVERFGIDRVSKAVRAAYDKGNYDERFTINHAIEPRKDREAGKIDKRNKAFTSDYWEEGATSQTGTKDQMLEESGFDENPIIAPPWELVAEDHYGIGPGEEALPDVKMLQLEQSDKLEAIAKKVRPPMTGPTSMKNNPASLLPGSITYVDDPTGRSGYRAAIEVDMPLGELREDIADVRQRMDRTFYADLFLMLTNMEGIQPRNEYEIAERKEEKLLALGPVLENIYGGQLEPVIDRTYAMLERARRMPPPPQELQGQNLKIEYISMLAQAQKAVATGALERTWAFAGRLGSVKPEALDKLDADESIDLYADMVGVSPSVVVPDEKVQAARKARADAQAQQARAEQFAQMAPAAKQGAEAAQVLSNTDTADPSKLLAQLGIGG